MSTKKETTQKQDTTNKYNPLAMGAYEKGVGGGMDVLQQFMQDPYKNAFFLQQLGMINRQASLMGQRGMSNLGRQAQMSGWGGTQGNAWLQSQQAKQGRATSSLMAQGQNALLPQFAAMRLGSAQDALRFQPLQIGGSMTGSSTEKTSGLGTWLPQLIGAGLGMASGFMTGGASAMGGGMGGGGGSPFGSISSGGFGQFLSNAPGGGVIPGQGGSSLANFGRPCWVAAELYGGWDAPRTVEIRKFLSESSDPKIRVFVDIYQKMGPQWAVDIQKDPALRKTVKTFFDRLGR